MLCVGTHAPDALRPLGERPCKEKRYAHTVTRSIQRVRDDTKHRHEVSDGFEECSQWLRRKSLPANVVPEPSTVASLLSLGIVGLSGYWWRRRRT